MEISALGVLLALACCNALRPDVIFEEPNGVRLRLSDEPSLQAVKFEVQPTEQSIYKQFIEHTVDGVWEFFDPELSVQPGDTIKYRLTAYYKDDVVETDWILHQFANQFRLVRSMKRATAFRDDYTSCSISSLKQHYTVGSSAWGGGNNEFQVYVPDSRNLYCSGGSLYIKPTLTVDHPSFDENKLRHGRMSVQEMYGYCTQGSNWGCDRTAVNGNVLNPIMSGKLTSKASIRYGRVNVRAFIPKGDWIWPAIWMLPSKWHYGGWPRSGEIDLMEARCNQRAASGNNDHGIGEVSSTLHWGPSAGRNCFQKTHGEKDTGGSNGWHGWHTYSLEWDAGHIKTMVDGQTIMYIGTPGNSYWNWCNLGGGNIWSSGGKDAPFDQPFQLILNVAVGGGFFPSSFQYNQRRPWTDGSSRQMGEFWDHKNEWLSTWHGDNVAMKIDYVEMIQQ